ncbi:MULTISPECIES: hypothetical protein [Flavobacterium]|uniref:Alpha-ketoglutarate decarboxylase n=1 Tax=Flavobacterium hankyongi TaxID=1176532 RepID=A0ABP8ZQG6_9FLAO|nr:hypothetical protein [Flavobacterium sp. N1846]
MNSDRRPFVFLTRITIYVQFLLCFSFLHAQDSLINPKKNIFWERVQIGGGLGLGIGSNYTNISVAPSAIYPVNEYFSTGLGVQYSYIKQKDFYNSHIYGASLITLFNPIHEVQLSAELEQLRVNNTYTAFLPLIKDNFWNTALFLGAGYRSQNVTVGIRYNILYRESNNVYSQAWMPFVRVYF